MRDPIADEVREVIANSPFGHIASLVTEEGE